MLLKSNYRNYPLASKNCLKSLSKQLLVRKGLLVLFLVLRVSLRCLIYKVHTANRGGSFIVPHPIALVNTFFQISLISRVGLPS